MGRAFEFRKARKMKRWSAMAKTFTRIGKDIVTAVKEGGPNPESNSRLRAVMQNAKAANMPKDNIERAIKKATDKDTANYKEVLFEGYAPHGIAILLETATDNNNRTVANVRAAFNKYDGSLSTSGSVIFMFDHTCNFTVKKEDITDMEELELELIDFEVEEIFDDEEGIIIYAPFEQFGAIQSFFEENNVEILSSGFERIPTTTTKLTEEQQAEVFSFVEDYQSDRTEIDMDKAIELKKKQISLVTQPDFDEAEMEKVIDTVQATEKSMVMQEMRLKNNIYNVLTEEQKEQFKTMMKSVLSGNK